VLRPVLARAKMLARYDQVELQAAVVNAVFSAYIESPNDPELVQDALSPDAGLPAYQAMRSEFHADKRLQLNGVRIPTLFPGEKINTVAAARPSGNFPAFQSAMLRNLASAAGLDAGTLVRLGATVAPGIPLDADRVGRRLREGATLADTLRESGGFPPTLIEGVIAGELTGNTAEVLDRLARDYDEEARQKFEASAQVAGFVVWGLVAALIALVIFRIFSFYVGAIQALAG
jgi:hypothetical protein